MYTRTFCTYVILRVASRPIRRIKQTLIKLFMQGLTDGPFRTYLFRLEFDTLEEAIRVAEQEDFSMK